MVFSNIKPINAVQKRVTGSSGEAGYITIVYSQKNGKRVLLAKEVVEKLELEDKVFIFAVEDKIAFSKNDISGVGKEFRLKECRGRKVIYCGSLVEELTEKFNLTFENRVCHTLTNATFEVNEESDNQELVVVIAKNKLGNIEGGNEIIEEDNNYGD